jgi:hypothetical protein
MKKLTMFVSILCVALCISGCDKAPDVVRQGDGYDIKCINGVSYIHFIGGLQGSLGGGVTPELNGDGSIVKCKVKGEE